MAQTEFSRTDPKSETIKEIVKELETFVEQTLINKQAEEIAQLKAELEEWKMLATRSSNCANCLAASKATASNKRPITAVKPSARKILGVKKMRPTPAAETVITPEVAARGLKAIGGWATADPCTILKLVDTIFPMSSTDPIVWIDPRMVNIVTYMCKVVNDASENAESVTDFLNTLATDTANVRNFVEARVRKEMSKEQSRKEKHAQLYKRILYDEVVTLHSPVSCEEEIKCLNIIRSYK